MIDDRDPYWWTELSPTQIWYAHDVARQRNENAIRDGREPAYGAKKAKALHLHQVGCECELAYCWWAGRPWEAKIDTYKQGSDVAENVQIRGRTKHWYDLIFRPDDKDDHAYVLVTAQTPRYCIRGWLWGRECRNEEWWHNYGDRDPAYFPLQSALRTCFDPIPHRKR